MSSITLTEITNAIIGHIPLSTDMLLPPSEMIIPHKITNGIIRINPLTPNGGGLMLLDGRNRTSTRSV